MTEHDKIDERRNTLSEYSNEVKDFAKDVSKYGSVLKVQLLTTEPERVKLFFKGTGISGEVVNAALIYELKLDCAYRDYAYESGKSVSVFEFSKVTEEHAEALRETYGNPDKNTT